MIGSDAPLWLSLGENCLPDDILQRHGRKSFSTPFSSARSNIDYVLAMEAKVYGGLLAPQHLVRASAWGRPVVRSSLYVEADDLFEEGCSQGFEFTHHDPISSTRDSDSFARRIARLNEIRKVREVVFLYHHRYTSRSDLPRLRAKLVAFSQFYTGANVGCRVISFHQRLVKDLRERRLEMTHSERGLVEFAFHTQRLWGGNDQDVFWARVDDDLISALLSEVDARLAADAAPAPACVRTEAGVDA